MTGWLCLGLLLLAALLDLLVKVPAVTPLHLYIRYTVTLLDLLVKVSTPSSFP